MTDQKPATIAAALAELQTQLPRVAKGETARVKSDKGSYSYTYANLADISAALLPLLGSVGLSFTARPTLNPAGTFVLAYELLHTSGENRCGEYPLPTGGTPQTLGSAITYGRRYCLCAITGVAPDNDDDDGAAAEKAARTAQNGRSANRGQQPPPAEQHTDHAWLTDMEARISVAANRGELTTLAREISDKRVAGQCEQVHADHLWELGTARQNRLGIALNQDGSLSRSQMTDEALANEGVMTGPEKRDHNALRRDGEPRKGEVETGTLSPDEDPWATAGVPGGEPGPEPEWTV